MRLAICSTNRKKYSETFVRMLYDLLGEHGLVCSDGYLPKAYSTDKGKTFSPIVGAGNDEERLEALFVSFKISHVLAEYGPTGVMIMGVCHRLKIPMTVHFHGYDAYRQDILGSYGQDYPELFARAKSIIVVSEDMRKQIVSLGCPQQKTHLVRCGVDTDLFRPSPKTQTINKLIYCGRFVPKKNPELVIRTFAKIRSKIPSARLTMIGDGELLHTCKMMAAELGLSSAIEFTGAIDQRLVAQYFKEHTIYLQFSSSTEDNDSEGTPLSMLEAMSSGLAVVATNHAGIPEVVSHMENGVIVDTQDPIALAEQVLDIIQRPALSKELTESAQNLIMSKYTKVHYLEDVRQIIIEKEE